MHKSRPVNAKLIVSGAIAIVALSCFPAAIAAEESPNMSAGFDLLRSKDYARALDVFNKAAKTNPESVDARFGQAQALEGLGRREESVKMFQLCLLMKPSATVAEACKKEINYMTLQPPTIPQPTVTERDVERTTTAITNQTAQRIRDLQRQAQVPLRTFTYPTQLPIRRTGRWMPPRTQPAYRFDRDLYRRTTALSEAASGLKTAMTTKPSQYDNIYLSPYNTNLYVRNYVPFDPARSLTVEPILATQLTFTDIKKTPQQTKALPKKK